MRIKFGALAVSGSGKIGGQYASSKSSGHVLSSKFFKHRIKKNASLRSRQYFNNVVALWYSLTPLQIKQWNTFASTLTRSDIFGDKKTASGYNAFMQLNYNLELARGTLLTEPPPFEQVLTPSFGAISMVSSDSEQSISVAFSPAVTTSFTYLLYATRPMSSGVSNAKSQMVILRVIRNFTLSPFTNMALYLAKFGTSGHAGQIVHFKLISVSRITGFTSTEVFASVIITD